VVKRRGKPEAFVAVARAVPVTTWQLLNDPTLRFQDLTRTTTVRVYKHRKARDRVHGLEALVSTVALTAAA
jgi:hypothetical protein